MLGNDPDTERFYGKQNWPAVLATDDFKKWIYETLLPELTEEVKSHVLKPNLTLTDITEAVDNFYGSSEFALRQVIEGPDKGNEGSKVAMYLCQEILDERLSYIATYFNLGHSGSVSFITHQIRTLRTNDKAFAKKGAGIMKSIMKQVT